MTNSELLTRRQTAVVRGVSQATPVFAERALNSEIWDVEGKRYVDFAGGIAVLNTGHCHPRIVAAIREQLDRFTHTCFQVAPYEGYIRLAERLNQLAPINGPLKSILLSTGAEATENAVKIARAATGRSGVIAFTGGFHGRTAFASAMTGKVIPYKKALGPPLPGVWHVPFPVAGSDVSVEDALRCVQFVFKADIDASQVAAIIIEPVQGEGGFHQAPPELMRGLRRLCDENGIVLIADEVQTGFGRTGKMFAMEHYDVQADIVCVAKSLAGGLPLSGVIGRAAIMDAAEPGGLGGTYAGNPLACAAALAVLDVRGDRDVLDHQIYRWPRHHARRRDHRRRQLPLAAARRTVSAADGAGCGRSASCLDRRCSTVRPDRVFASRAVEAARRSRRRHGTDRRVADPAGA